MACDVSWKSRLSKLNDENVLLKTQVDFVVKKIENIKLEFQTFFNSIKATRAQHQQEVNELIKSISQKTYVYGDVRSENQDLLMIISELKDKLKTFEKGKSVNTKFDKSVTLGKLLLESSNSVRRPQSKDIKLNNRVLKNTNDKSSSAHVRKVSISVRIDSNKRETVNSTICQSNASVLNTKTVNSVNDGSNIVCVSYGKDVFMLSHDKCVARYALPKNSRVKRALFTTPVAAKSKNLGATSIVAKSRLSVAKTPTATNKVYSALSLSPDSSQSRTLNNYMKNKIATSRKWQNGNFVEKFMGTVRFRNDHFAAINGYGDYVQGNLTICHVYYVEGLGHYLFLVGQFCDEDLQIAFHSNTCYVRNLEGDDLLTGSRDSNLYTISILDWQILLQCA
ncbi:hypothetical protein Tco_0817849 [Tanacetum coccineum]